MKTEKKPRMSVERRQEIKEAMSGGTNDISAGTVTDLGNLGYSLEQIGIVEHTICACGGAHHDNHVILFDFNEFGEHCEECHEIFNRRHAELAGKTLQQTLLSGHPLLTREKLA